MNVLRWLAVFAVMGLPVQAMADERVLPSAPQEVTIRLNEYRFEPARVELRSGQPVALHLVNSGQVLHEFVSEFFADVTVDLEASGVIALVPGLEELEVLPGGRVTLRFTPEKTGDFAFRCDAEEPVSHHANGMKGVLAVR